MTFDEIINIINILLICAIVSLWVAIVKLKHKRIKKEREARKTAWILDFLDQGQVNTVSKQLVAHRSSASDNRLLRLYQKVYKSPENQGFPGFFSVRKSVGAVRFWWNLNGNLWVYSGQITGVQAHFDHLWVKLLVDNRSKWSPILPSTDEHILDWFT